MGELRKPITSILRVRATIVDSTHSPPETGERFPFMALLIGFAMLDLLAPPLIKLSGWEFLGLLLLGLLSGQLGLLAIWAVLGPQRWTVRQTVTFGLTLLFYLLFNVSWTLSAGDENAGFEIWRVLSAPLLLLAIQSPLWILRMAIGCRILHAPTETDASSKLSRQFALSHLLGAIAVIAIAVALAGLTKPAREAWAETLSTCLLHAAWSALSTLPCLWAALVARDERISTRAIAAYVLVATLLLLLAPSALGGRVPSLGSFLSVGLVIFLFLAASIGLMLAVLRLARTRGFVLVRRKSQERATGDDWPSETDPGGPQASSVE